jgi:hypothetical protein
VDVGGCWWTCCTNAISAGCGTVHLWIFDTRTRSRDEVGYFGFGLAWWSVIVCPSMCVESMRPPMRPSCAPIFVCPSACVLSLLSCMSVACMYMRVHLYVCLARQGSSGSCFGGW